MKKILLSLVLVMTVGFSCGLCGYTVGPRKKPEVGGHSLSVSDLVELYDDEGEGHQALYYWDVIGFKKVTNIL